MKAKVEEAIREIRADYGVDPARAKAVQDKYNKNKGQRTDVLGDDGVATIRQRQRQPRGERTPLAKRLEAVIRDERKRAKVGGGLGHVPGTV